MRTRGIAPIAALLLTASGDVAEAEPAAAEQATRTTMGQIVDSMAFVLPLATSDERFADPAQRKAIQAALDALAMNAAKVESHGQGRDLGFTFLSRSLARDAREVRDRFAAGRPAEARFLLVEMSDDCAACHSRLPDRREHPVGRRLVDDPRVAKLDLDERVNLEVATRQFDRALASYEALFADPARSPSDFDLEGHVDGYLEVVVRVQNDPERALRTFSALAQRKDLPANLRENLGAWIASLRALRGRTFSGTPLAQARALVAEAQDVSRYPDHRSALVVYLAASGILNRFIAGKPSRPELGEAAYLLGVIESRIGRSFWLSGTEFYLEQAILLAPQQPFASDAYDLLEEFLVSGYTGTQGSEVPPDVRAHLDELKGRIRRAQGS